MFKGVIRIEAATRAELDRAISAVAARLNGLSTADLERGGGTFSGGGGSRGSRSGGVSYFSAQVDVEKSEPPLTDAEVRRLRRLLEAGGPG